MQSPCVTCENKDQNKEDYQKESCSTTCKKIKLFQKAVKMAEQFGPAKQGQCLVCRLSCDEDYCQVCTKLAELPPPRLVGMKKTATDTQYVALKAIKEGRFCECGRPATIVGMCPGCRRKYLRHHPEEKKHGFTKKKLSYTTTHHSKNGINPNRKCEFCDQAIPNLGGDILRRESYSAFYAHRQCAVDSGRIIFIDDVQITHIDERSAA